MLSQSEQVKQNEDSAKGAAKLVKPITANDKWSFNKPANCKDEYNRKIRQTGWTWPRNQLERDSDARQCYRR